MTYDITIIGAGLVGLSTAYQLSLNRPDLSIAIIEKENEVALHQSGNNSGVIHSGIYYKPGSLKAANCIRGYQMLLDFCDEYGLPYDLCGKIIMATEHWEIPILQAIYEKGMKNDLEGIRKIGADEIKSIEPNARGLEGIHVPQAGCIGFRLVARQLKKILNGRGVDFHFKGELKNGVEKENIFELEMENKTLLSHYVINCAGLYADKVAQIFGEEMKKMRILPFRGEYYELIPEKTDVIKGLIYPVPNPNFPFLGVHFTKTINGGVEAGPNAVLALSREGYSKKDIHWKELSETLSFRGFRKLAWKYKNDGMMELKRSFSKKEFTASLQKLVPGIQESDLKKAGAGVRATLCDNEGRLFDDYVIIRRENVMHVLNAPSPAATSCLSIGKTLSEMFFDKV